MISRRKPAVIVSAVVGIILLILVFPMLRLHSGTRSEEMKVLISKQLPIGADKVAVIAYLDKSGIEHSAYLENEKRIYGIVRDVCYGFLIECSIDMKFQFDERGKLASFSVEEGLTGL